MLQIFSPAPDFSAVDQTGTTHSLADYQGRWLLLYFYPKDNTPGCTTEACVLRDNFSAFSQLGAAVLGVSADSAASHARFVAKYSLPFPLLVDGDKNIARAYEAHGLLRRRSYLIDPQGRIAKIYPKVKPAEHAAEVLADLRELLKTTPRS